MLNEFFNVWCQICRFLYKHSAIHRLCHHDSILAFESESTDLFYFDLNPIHLHPQQLYFPFPMHHASLISPLQQNKNPTAWGNFSKTKMLTDQFKASRWNKHQSFRPPIYIFCSLGHFAPNLSCVFHPKVYFTAVPIGIGTQLDSTDTWALIINAMAALALHHVQPASSSLNLKLKEKLEENWFNHKSKLRKWGDKKHEILDVVM